MNSRVIGLEELSEVEAYSLEYKFLLEIDRLNGFLEKLESSDVYFLEDKNKLFQAYNNYYFDKADLKFLKNHLRAKFRIKIRKRYYANTDNCYLEIKLKNLKGERQKLRYPGKWERDISERENGWIVQNGVNGKKLVVQSEMRFERASFYSSDFSEKLTIDKDLKCDNLIELKNYALIELKSKKKLYANNFYRELLKPAHLRNISFSKYVYSQKPKLYYAKLR